MSLARAMTVMVLACLGSALCGGSIGWAADEPSAHPSTAAPDASVLDGSQSVQRELEQLRQLRREHPERFRQEVAARKEALRGQLRTLKQEHPEQFRQLMARIRDQRRRRLEALRTTDPERYRQLMAQRQAHVQARMQQLRREDPQRYEAVQRQVLERRQQFLQQHPGWVDRSDHGGEGARPATTRPRDGEADPTDRRR